MFISVNAAETKAVGERLAEKIQTGDIVTIEVWGVDNHYKAGAQASIYVGSHPPDALVQAYREDRISGLPLFA